MATEIVMDPDVLHGNPRLKDWRIGVFMLAEPIRRGDRTKEETKENFPSLSIDEIETALEYYDSHPELMRYLRIREELAAKQARQRGPNPAAMASE